MRRWTPLLWTPLFWTPLFWTLLLLTLPRTAWAERSLPVLYTLYCSGCHGAAGHGVPSQGIPDLHDAGAYAMSPAGRAYLAEVPGIAQSHLDDATAARMLNYVLHRFSGDRLPAGFRPYGAGEVALLRKADLSDAATRRRALLATMGK